MRTLACLVVVIVSTSFVYADGAVSIDQPQKIKLVQRYEPPAQALSLDSGYRWYFGKGEPLSAAQVAVSTKLWTDTDLQLLMIIPPDDGTPKGGVGIATNCLALKRGIAKLVGKQAPNNPGFDEVLHHIELGAAVIPSGDVEEWFKGYIGFNFQVAEL